MKKNYIKTIFLGIAVISSIPMESKKIISTSTIKTDQYSPCRKVMKKTNEHEKKTDKKIFVHKYVLKNGLTVLVRVVETLPKVSIQIWYNVGSKDEKTGERGIAHLIEHMIFKGTTVLSESDINELIHKLSGSCNAFTANDYTGYLFNMPKHNWEKIMPIIANCMQDVQFKEDHLSSEMKAVIQELKMRRDNYTISLLQELISSIFADHPYHYPIIGYKQDLWNVHSDDLKKFYQKHYIPNNATLVVVGDVDPDRVFELTEKYFGNIKPNNKYTKDVFYHNKDISSKSVTLHRDVQQPVVVNAFVVPGTGAKTDNTLEILSNILGSGKSSRLYRKLVDQLHLVTEIQTFSWELFDYTLFCIYYEPKKLEDIDKINHLITQEIEHLAKQGASEQELKSAIKRAQMDYYKLLENTEKQAYQIGKYYLALGDENYIFKFLEHSPDYYQQKIKELLTNYGRPAVMHKGLILPLTASEKKEWEMLQALSDKEDEQILSERIRTTPVEPPVYAHTVIPNKPGVFDFPKAKETVLSNGIKVFSYSTTNTPNIALLVDFKAKYYYDPEEKQGLANFVASMLDEGTERYTGSEFADELARYGMSLTVSPGSILLLMHHDDFEKGVELIKEIVTKAAFDKQEVEKVREQILATIRNFWDEPSQFVSQILKSQIYKDHPYSKDVLGTQESIESISRDDLLAYYKKYITPAGTRIAVVGDLAGYDVECIMNRILGDWAGPQVEDIAFPVLPEEVNREVNYCINRDQIVLCFAQKSIDRKDPDYDKLLLFDQILGGGALGSLSSRLFQLREQSGLFYTISGSLLSNISEQPGMVLVKTIVSPDRLHEAEAAIKNTLAQVISNISPEELQQAKDAVINSIMYNFESNRNIAQAFLFLDKYKLPKDYFDKRAQALEKITVDQVKEAVRRVLHVEKLLTLRAGRVEQLQETGK